MNNNKLNKLYPRNMLNDTPIERHFHIRCGEVEIKEFHKAYQRQLDERFKINNMDKIKERIDLLRRELTRHNYNYYVLSNPEISDFEYDFLMKSLEQLEKEYPEFDDKNSPSKVVGSDLK